MSRYALIRTDAPASVIRYAEFGAAPELAPAKGLKWIPDTSPLFDPQTQRLQLVEPVPIDATEVPYTLEDIPLAELRATRKAAAKDKRKAVEQGGIVVGGIAVATDRESQGMLTGAKKSLDDGLVTPPIDWQTESDAFVAIDGTTLGALAMAVAQHVQACFTRQKELYAAIEAAGADAQMTHAARAAEILAVDIEAGWPSNV